MCGGAGLGAALGADPELWLEGPVQDLRAEGVGSGRKPGQQTGWAQAALHLLGRGLASNGPECWVNRGVRKTGQLHHYRFFARSGNTFSGQPLTPGRAGGP